jgi:transcriptional regulator with XRE-family HTH domain
MNFGTQLRVMRAARNMSQAKLAEMTGISSVYLSAYENGKSLPGPEAERALRKALQWTADVDAALAMLQEAANG